MSQILITYQGSENNDLLFTAFKQFELILLEKLQPYKYALAVCGGQVNIQVTEAMNVKVDFERVPGLLEKRVREALRV